MCAFFIEKCDFFFKSFFIAEQNKISVDEFIERLQKIDETYPYQNLFVLQNLLSSHDTERLSSMIKNPDRKYEHDANEGNANYNPGKPGVEIYEKQKLIAAFQILYRGAPMIYYGDEVGMWGADDPHDRKPMIWDDLVYDNEVIDESSGFKIGFGSYSVEQNKDLLKFYKELIAIRNNNEELKTGTVKFIYSDNEKLTFAFESVLADKKIICAFNLGENEASIPLDFEAIELYPGNQETNIKSIAANSFKVYKAKK